MEKNPLLTIQDLESHLSETFTEKERKKIQESYQYASEKHFGQKRLTGEDYINHPLNVAVILTELQADCTTLCAALLHDVMEDCNVSFDELESLFGRDVAKLVDGVTKINKLNFSGSGDAQIATHRKILVGLCEDVRVIFIKLADRLHNMRTLWIMSEKQQKDTARETLDILTPVAHRLGIYHMKAELEDLSLRYLKPDAYFSIVEQLNQTKLEREHMVLEMQNSVSAILNEHHIHHKIKGRAKSIYSIYKKLDKGKKFSDIYDLSALRVFVDTIPECYQALGIIHAKYKPMSKRFKDYVARPKTNMYQSLHTTVFGVDGYLFEIQIRTHEMDAIAENGIASHWSYKEHSDSNVLQNTMEQKLQFFRSLMELQEEHPTDEEFVKSVKEDILNNTIYVFTPQGDVIELPNGSTPIDFAYKVHSEVGDKMVGAMVNNAIVPLDYQLKTDDIVKINTNKNSFGPSREWISIAKTSQAKNKIKSFFNRIDKEENLKHGEELFAKELRKKKLSYNEFLSNENVDRILKEFHVSNLQELYIGIGNGKYLSSTVIHFIENDTEKKEDLILKRVQNQMMLNIESKNDVLVEGCDDIKVNIASCCRPIPGDRIVGYITRGNGVSVHRMICPNVSDLEECLIDVKWNTIIKKKYPTSLLIHADENKNVLLDIIAKTNNNGVVVQSINTLNGKGFLYEITVLVESKEQLMKFIHDIEMLSNITSIERFIK